MPDKVTDDVVVSMQYKLYLADSDQLLEETSADEPITYLQGHENLIAGLESEMEGMAVGDERTVTLDPEDAYGNYEEDRIRDIPRSELPDDIAVDQALQVMDTEGNQYIARVTDLSDESAQLDFNHPLAGQRLRFEVTVTDLRDPTDEELEHGHVHDGHHH